MKKIKPIKLKFFETFLYGLIYWISLLATILVLLSSLIVNADQLKTILITSIITALIAFVFKLIQNKRRKSLSKKVKVLVDESLSYSPEEIKHYIGLKDGEDKLSESYFNMCRAFDGMAKSKLSCLILSREDSGQRDGTMSITVTDMSLKRRVCDVLFYSQKVPSLVNLSGHIFYLYPHFVLYVAGRKKVIAMPYAELDLDCYDGSFTLSADQKTPRDAEVIGFGYQFVNKDGSPDKRVANNPSTPKISVGKLRSDNYNMEYMFSNLTAVEEFWEKYIDFVEILEETLSTKAIAQELTKELKEGTLTIESIEEVADSFVSKGGQISPDSEEDLFTL